MKRWDLLGLGIIAGVSSLLISALPGFAQSRLRLETHPQLDAVIPFHQPLTVNLKTTDGAGLTLEDTKVQVKVLAPAKTPWLTTDFPVVEGTTLLDMAIAPNHNQVQFQFMPPIRGSYQLDVTVTPEVTGSFEPFTETLTLQVPENPEKYHNLLVLLAILGIFGFGGGWIIGGQQESTDGAIASQPVRILLSASLIVALITVLYIAISAEMANAHPSHSTERTQPQVGSQPSSTPLNVEVEDLAIAKVGQAIPLEVEITNPVTGEPATEVNLAITTRLLADNQTVTSFLTTPNPSGQYSWKQQFFDGSPHRVTVLISPQPQAEFQFQPFEVVHTIDVEAVEPPMSVRLISLSYLTTFLAAAFGIGFSFRRRFQKSSL